MTDNRTNEPNENQVEAAAKAIYEVSPNGGIEWDSAEFDEWMERGDYRAKARAALVAAQGAAPQAESEYEHLLKARALHQTNAGLPSSGVDEDKLAEVIARSRGFGNGWEQIPPLTRGAYREVARAVAEWLKGQGR